MRQACPKDVADPEIQVFIFLSLPDPLPEIDRRNILWDVFMTSSH
jgi:hypothetical protein